MSVADGNLAEQRSGLPANSEQSCEAGSEAVSEVAALRARIERLEAEHAEEIARLQRALAAAQERAYWLDRWHIDLNRWMVTGAGERFRQLVRAVRGVVRGVRLAKRKLNER